MSFPASGSLCDLHPSPTRRSSDLFVVARPGVPSRTYQEFLAHARANPGKLNYGSAGSGTLQHIAIDRKSTRLNSSHLVISYAVFCLKKKTKRSPILSHSASISYRS